MSYPTQHEPLLEVCVDAIDHHAQLLATVLRSILWSLAAQEHGKQARRAVQARDWTAAAEALADALSLVLGGYGPRSLPPETAAWARVCESVLGHEPERWPDEVEHEGRTFWATGKWGNNCLTGVAAAEYEDARAARVWRLATGAIERE